MSEKEQTQISVDKLPLIVVAISLLGLAACGVGLILNSSFSNTTGDNIFIAIGFVMLLSGAYGVCFILKKIMDTTSGLIINDEGITINVSETPAGLVKWEDIQQIEKISVKGNLYLMVIVSNPEEYIDRQSGAAKRKLASITYKTYGSPISIPLGALKMSYGEISLHIGRKLKESNNS